MKSFEEVAKSVVKEALTDNIKEQRWEYAKYSNFSDPDLYARTNITVDGKTMSVEVDKLGKNLFSITVLDNGRMVAGNQNITSEEQLIVIMSGLPKSVSSVKDLDPLLKY